MNRRIFLAFAMPFVLGISTAAFGKTVSTAKTMDCCCGDSCPMKKDAAGKETCNCDDCDCCGAKAKTSDHRVNGIVAASGKTCDCCKKKAS